MHGSQSQDQNKPPATAYTYGRVCRLQENSNSLLHNHQHRNNVWESEEREKTEIQDQVKEDDLKKNGTQPKKETAKKIHNMAVVKPTIETEPVLNRNRRHRQSWHLGRRKNRSQRKRFQFTPNLGKS